LFDTHGRLSLNGFCEEVTSRGKLSPGRSMAGALV
jgi:hypothetical protein